MKSNRQIALEKILIKKLDYSILQKNKLFRKFNIMVNIISFSFLGYIIFFYKLNKYDINEAMSYVFTFTLMLFLIQDSVIVLNNLMFVDITNILLSFPLKIEEIVVANIKVFIKCLLKYNISSLFIILYPIFSLFWKIKVLDIINFILCLIISILFVLASAYMILNFTFIILIKKFSIIKVKKMLTNILYVFSYLLVILIILFKINFDVIILMKNSIYLILMIALMILFAYIGLKINISVYSKNNNNIKIKTINRKYLINTKNASIYKTLASLDRKLIFRNLSALVIQFFIAIIAILGFMFFKVYNLKKEMILVDNNLNSYKLSLAFIIILVLYLLLINSINIYSNTFLLRFSFEFNKLKSMIDDKFIINYNIMKISLVNLIFSVVILISFFAIGIRDFNLIFILIFVLISNFYCLIETLLINIIITPRVNLSNFDEIQKSNYTPLFNLVLSIIIIIFNGFLTMTNLTTLLIINIIISITFFIIVLKISYKKIKKIYRK